VGKIGLGARVAACVAAVALAGFAVVALIGLVSQRAIMLDRFDSSSSRVSELLADDMAGSVRFARSAGIEAAFAGLKENEPDLAAVLVTDAKGGRLTTWKRDRIDDAALTVAMPSGSSLLDAGGITIVEVAVRQTRDSDAVGTLRTLWSHERLDQETRSAALRQGIISLVSMLAMTALLYAVLRRIAIRPLIAMTKTTVDLAHGRLDVAVGGVDRSDEIGAMAQSIEVFKKSMIEGERLRAEQAQMKARSEAEKKDAMDSMASDFEASVKGIVQLVSSASTELQTTARSMSVTADETSRRSTAVAAASELASSNVQTIASAAEQLSSSIGEIGQQVAESTRIARQAVADAESTNVQIKSLADAAQRIGDVVKLINDIAGQTNLLALNATIEAARAGEAGKGFAVVASEVKSLATQTAKATDEIGSKIAEMQAATEQSVQAVQAIGRTIGRVSEIATTIASAVEEQGAATKEIARTVQQASDGTHEVSSNIVGVTKAAADTGATSSQVLNAASALAKQSDLLSGQVDGFISKVRAA